MVAATFRHDTSRNLYPQLHTHCVIANMVEGGDGKWRTMVNDGLYRQQKAISAIYRSELAEGLVRLGYEIDRTHWDGRFEIAGVPRDVIEAFSTRRAEIEAAMKARGFDDPGDNKKLADRAALMTRAHKRDVDKGELRRIWSRQASELEFSPETVLDRARGREAETSTWGTQGRGRYDRDRQYDKPKKDVWLRPLRRDWKRTLNRRAASKSLNDDAFTVKRVGAAPEANSGCALPHGTWPTR